MVQDINMAMYVLEELVKDAKSYGSKILPASKLTHTLHGLSLKMHHHYREAAVKRCIVKDCVKTPDGSLNFIL